MHHSMGHECPINPTVVFSINAVAIIPLASLLSFATENVTRNLGDQVGTLLNVTFGNAVELISLEQHFNLHTPLWAAISCLIIQKLLTKILTANSIALVALKSHAYFYESTPQHKIDEEFHPGVVLAELLSWETAKIIGKAPQQRQGIVDNLVIRVLDKEDQPPSDSTGFTHAERHVNFTADTAHSAEAESVKRPFNVCSLSTRQVFPQVFANGPHLCNTHTTPTVPSGSQCNSHENQCGLRRAGSLSSRFRSLLSQPIMPSAHPLPQLMAVVPPESPNGIETEARGSLHLSRTVSDIPLLVSTGLVAVCAEFLVDSIDYLVESTGVSQAFIVSIILPIVGNAAEHITAVVVASENKIDLAIGVALGSKWCLNTEMSLYFSLFKTVSLFASAFIVSYLVLDGRTNYLEGALFISAYVIIALAAFFYLSCENLSSASGPRDAGGC
ncbi:calcium/proton exchanger [[Emmonsia] crescens]|uniref:Calcium/proton exchanger n=1 Tax=[Emmonsia] crescens TaxID=73230 RepID=A0A2B7ZEG9_9EURO|nr:calcium/proton exchanger [Emmonsia crescens]